jgi:hypothetical protein
MTAMKSPGAVAALGASEIDGLEGRAVSLNRQSEPSRQACKRGTIVGRDRLVWRGLNLQHGQSREVLVRVIPDGHWRGMYRVQFAHGHVGDMANLSRAKDAALAAGLRHLNSEVQGTALEGRPFANSPTGTA